MIINLKTAKMLSITLKRRPLLGRAGIEQLAATFPDHIADRPGRPMNSTIAKTLAKILAKTADHGRYCVASVATLLNSQ